LPRRSPATLEKEREKEREREREREGGREREKETATLGAAVNDQLSVARLPHR